MLSFQTLGEFLGRPELLKPRRHLVTQRGLTQLRLLGSPGLCPGSFMGSSNAVITLATVGGDLSGHGRGRSTKSACDRTHRLVRPQSKRNLLTFFESQPSSTRNPLIVTALSFLTGQDDLDVRRTGKADVLGDAPQGLTLLSKPMNQLSLLFREMNTHRTCQ